MVRVAMLTGDIGVDRFQPVRPPLFGQGGQRAIDGGGRDAGLRSDSSVCYLITYTLTR